MATVVFYEKPGCSTNARQRRLLTEAGHTVVAMSVLSETWTPERLRPYFAGTPVSSWFNRAAPRVKSGDIDPERLDAETALALMAADPLLIRRPLIDANGRHCAGFEREPVTSLLGGDAVRSDIEGCSRAPGPCPEPSQAPAISPARPRQ